jgi:potassium-transporting ATPase KdpC subunit
MLILRSKNMGNYRLLTIGRFRFLTRKEKMFREQLKITILIFLILTVLTGIIYPLLVTGIGQVLFNHQANGSLIYHEGKIVGSSLIGQPFDDPKYLWGRLSATSPVAYNPAASSGSNLGPSNPALLGQLKNRIQILRANEPDNKKLIPVDLVTASASGLDPHISLAGAYYQVKRIAITRGIPENTVKDIILRHKKERFLGLIGEPTVNVLLVNLDLDSYKK